MKALIVSGDGINCQDETAEAFRLAGFSSEIKHINDLISHSISVDDLSKDYAVLALPGGFSFGDDLASGKVLALKMKHGLNWDLSKYASRGGMVLGVCNGFQALIRMGVFGPSVSITLNTSGKFIDQWVRVSPNHHSCLWLKGLGTVVLPIRHAEGRVILERTKTDEAFIKLDRQKMTCLKYDGINPNGSDRDLAGLCDSTGRILGLMPHPEAFVRWSSHPSWTRQRSRSGSPGEGLAIFENAYRAVKGGV